MQSNNHSILSLRSKQYPLNYTPLDITNLIPSPSSPIGIIGINISIKASFYQELSRNLKVRELGELPKVKVPII